MLLSLMEMVMKTAGNPEYVNEAYFELGKCYVAVNDIKCALQSFSKLLALAKRVADIEGVCNAHMELAFAYKVIPIIFIICRRRNVYDNFVMYGSI